MYIQNIIEKSNWGFTCRKRDIKKNIINKIYWFIKRNKKQQQKNYVILTMLQLPATNFTRNILKNILFSFLKYYLYNFGEKLNRHRNLKLKYLRANPLNPTDAWYRRQYFCQTCSLELSRQRDSFQKSLAVVLTVVHTILAHPNETCQTNILGNPSKIE